MLRLEKCVTQNVCEELVVRAFISHHNRDKSEDDNICLHSVKSDDPSSNEDTRVSVSTSKPR